MPDKPRISIIIVSWNVADFLRECLQSILKQPSDVSFEVIVVDNASTDATVELVRKEFPGVILIANDTNFGFAAANNQGILRASGEYLLLLNPDTQVLNNCLAMCLKIMAENHHIGILGCKHLNPDRTLQPSVRRLPRLVDQLLVATKLAKLLGNTQTIRRYYAKDFDYKKEQSAEQVAGSFLMFRRELLDEIGLLDEGFFIWFEEVDFCKRALDAGWEVWYTPRASIIHHGGQSFGQEVKWRNQLRFLASMSKYFQKHGMVW